MKREQHPLDQFLKDKLDSRSFEYQDAYWEAASELLGDQKRQRRGFWVWMLLGIGLVSGTIGWAMFSPAPEFNTSAVFAHLVWDSDWEFPDSCLMQTALASQQNVREMSPAQLERQEATSWVQGASGKPHGGDEDGNSEMNRFSSQEMYNVLARPETQRQPDWEEAFVVEGMKRKHYSLKNALKTTFLWKAPGDWKRYRHTIGITAGTQLAPSWRSQQLGSPSISPVLGMYYRYALTPTIRLQTGLLYQQRGSLNRDTAFTSVAFGFGRTENSTILSSRSLHFASLPITAEIAIGNRQSISLGVEPSLLLGVRTNVQEVTTGEVISTTSPDDVTWNYPQGYRKWDVSLQAGYNHYLGQGLRIGTVASYGLRDLTDNAYFTTGWIDRQINWRVWLEYDLKMFGSNGEIGR